MLIIFYLEGKMGEIKKTNNMLSMKVMLIFWIVVIIIGFIFGGIYVALGLIFAMVLSFIIMHFSMNSQWEGVIVSIKDERVYKGHDDELGTYVTFARIKLNNGKIKKVRSYPDWKVGDKIKKEKGEMSYKKITNQKQEENKSENIKKK
jgi:hypothetical protein